MPKNHNELGIIETIKWLNDIGCDQPLNIDKRSFNGIISSLNNVNEVKNFTEVSDSINFEKINTIKLLEQYLLSEKIIFDFNLPFYDGSNKADLMVIGDKPEDLTKNYKKPFQGEVGKLLDAMLKAINFDQTNTYYTNFYFSDTKLDLNVALEIIKKQISIINPKIIIMFGGEVTKILSNTDDSIFFSRGKWYDINIGDELNPIPGISMFHPRYILANQQSKKETWMDLKDVRKKLT